MYLAQLSTFQIQAPFYINTIEKIVSGNITPENKSNIDSAIFDAVDIANGVKNVFSINNEHYFLITTLLAKFQDQLLKIDKHNLQIKNYSEILNVLQ